MPIVADLQIWADNLESIVLPDIETDIDNLQVIQGTQAASITQTAQALTDGLAVHSIRIYAAQADATSADGKSNTALTEIYGSELAARIYTDAAISALRTELLLADSAYQTIIAGSVNTQITDEITDQLVDINATTVSLASTATALVTNAQANWDSIDAAVSNMLNTVLPVINVAVATAEASITATELSLNTFLTGFTNDSLVQGLDEVIATNELNLAPIAGSILRLPVNLWGRDLETAAAVLPKNTLSTYGTFLTADADFGECLLFGDATNINVGPAYPIDFSPDRIYKITATFKIVDLVGTTGAQVHLGVTTQTGVTLVEAYTSKPVQAAKVLSTDGVYTTSMYVGTDATILANYGILPADYIELTGSDAANKMYFFIEQNADLATNAKIKLASIFLNDVTEVVGNINALRVELQTNIDGLSATLTNDYYTSVQADIAIAGAELTLNSRIDLIDNSTTGTVAAVVADLSNNYYTEAQTDSAISTAALALSNRINLIDDATTGTVAVLTADLTNNYYTSVAADAAISAAALTLSNRIDVIDDATTGTVALLTADLTNNYYTSVAADVAISAASLTLSNRMDLIDDATTGTVALVTADLTNNYYTTTSADEATAAAVLILSNRIDLIDDPATGTVAAISANLSTNYYTDVGTDGAIAAAKLILDTRIDLVDNPTTGSLAALSSNLTTNYYTIVDGDSAIATAGVTLNARIDLIDNPTTGSVKSVEADLATNYYTIANVDSALSTLETNLAIKTVADGVSGDPAFSTWSGTGAPAGYATDDTAGTIVKNTLDARFGVAVEMTSASPPTSNFPYIKLGTNISTNVAPTDCSLVEGVNVKLHVALAAGAWGGTIAVQWVKTGTGGTSAITYLKPSDYFLNELNTIQSTEMYVERPASFVAGTGATYIQALYYGGHDNAGGDGYIYNKVIISFFDMQLVYLDAQAKLTQTAIKTVDGLSSAAFVMRAKAGGAAGSVEIVAADDPVNGSFSRVTLTGDEIGFDGLSVFDGPLQSSNFSAGSAGWQITEAGGAEFNNLINRTDIVDGAVSNGAFVNNVATPTHYANGTYVDAYDFGPISASEIWQFGMSISLKHALVIGYYSGKFGTWNASGRYLEVQPQWRLKENGLWGSWNNIGSVLSSNSYTVWRTLTVSTLLFGADYDGVELRLHVTHRMNISLEATGFTSDWNIPNLTNVNYVGRALVK